MNVFLNILKGNFLSGYKTYIVLLVPVILMTINWAVGADVTGLNAPVVGSGTLLTAWWAVISGVFLRKGVATSGK